MTIDGGTVNRSTVKTVLTRDSKSSKLHKVYDVISSEERMCSLCSAWGKDWVELDILGDYEVYCLECTSKGLYDKKIS